MFTKKISIIYLTKDKLKLAVIKLGKNPKILKSDETDWNKDSLAESFRQAKKQLKTKSITFSRRSLLCTSTKHSL